MLTVSDTAFYLELGCRRLSGLMHEDYQTRSEVVGSRKAAETRTLILERLPLFLHEHTHTKTRVSHSWLNNEKNFVVKTFGKLTVTKTLQLGDKRASKSQDASAVARRIGRGPIELWLAGHDTVDMYECVAFLAITVVTALTPISTEGYRLRCVAFCSTPRRSTTHCSS